MPVFSLLVGENFPSFEFSDSLPHYKVTLLHAPASTSGFILRAAPQPSTSEGPTVQITQLPNTLLRMKTLSPLPPPYKVTLRQAPISALHRILKAALILPLVRTSCCRNGAGLLSREPWNNGGRGPVMPRKSLDIRPTDDHGPKERCCKRLSLPPARAGLGSAQETGQGTGPLRVLRAAP